MITKGERTELRSIVRQQFKVLRAEVDQREAEMVAEAEQRVYDRFKGVDEKRADLNDAVGRLVEETNREIEKLLHDRADDVGGIESWQRLGVPRGYGLAHWSPDRRTELHRALVAGIEAQVQAAKLALQRQEADLLRTLAVGALESEEARKFLSDIPTVAQLVPTARLHELEAEFDQDADA